MRFSFYENKKAAASATAFRNKFNNYFIS